MIDWIFKLSSSAYVLIVGAMTFVISLLAKKNQKLNTENEQLKESEKQINAQATQTLEIIAKQAEIAVNTPCDADAVDGWLCSPKPGKASRNNRKAKNDGNPDISQTKLQDSE